ncbi:MAG: hypothetical protein C0490_07405 [Marivirga sp.]|nr:hypothetical protein [Marivirga sp.]
MSNSIKPMADIFNNQPSRFTLRFLWWFCPPKLYEGIEGDLVEQFSTDVKQYGLARANRRFIWNVIKFSDRVFYLEINSHGT